MRQQTLVLALSSIFTVAMTGCASDSSSTTSGVVVGSYFQGAQVCLDFNSNGACDAGEPSTTTDAQGRYTLSGSGSPVVAVIDPAVAKRLDASGNDIGFADTTKLIVLRAPKEAPQILSVQSTSVVAEMDTNKLTFDSAKAKVAATLGVATKDLLSDYNQLADTDVTRKILSAHTDSGLLALQTAYAKKGSNSAAQVLDKAALAVDASKIKTVVVIYAENRSFDNLYGLFPGANGISNATATNKTQLDRDGKTPLATLPAVWGANGAPAWNFVSGLPNGPFRIDAPPGGVPGQASSVTSPDLVHRFYNNKMQINGGANNLFAAYSDAGGLSMGYYDGSSMAMWKVAQQYVLADNFFQGAFGGSFLNHQWLVCACAPTTTAAPASRNSIIDSITGWLTLAATSPASALTGKPVYQGDLNFTPVDANGVSYAINTTQPAFQPSGTAPATSGDTRLADPNATGGNWPLPAQTAKTIGDTLTDKSVSWKWYAGAWNDSLADRTKIYNNTVPNFQPHHQPFNYYSRFDPTTTAGAAERAAHLKDYTDLVTDAQAGTLPQVSFYKPQGSLNQHPGYTDIMSGDAHIADVIAKLQASPQWANMAIIVTYDENGGFWDHAAPPKSNSKAANADGWGPGSRIPAIIVSPFAKKGFVDSTPYDTTSIIKFITRLYKLEPLPGAQKRNTVSDLSNAFDFSQP